MFHACFFCVFFLLPCMVSYPWIMHIYHRAAMSWPTPKSYHWTIFVLSSLTWFLITVFWNVIVLQQCLIMVSNVRRILKGGGGGGGPETENFRDFVPYFAQNQVKSKKKFFHSNFVPFFAQNHLNFQPKAWCPTYKGGGGHASILLTFLCNFAILANQRSAPLNTPLIMVCLYYHAHLCYR